ncbi:MAG: HD domain-containing protein [Desulfobacterales bacterium]|nr:HD domain-containing protein [Desulfobacterales bacterium]
MTQININFLPTELPRSAEVYIVGGTVRDILLGKKPSDYDIVTTGNPEALAGLIAAAFNSRVIRLGKPGMTLLRVKAQKYLFDIVPAFNGAIESDLQQRDFTINAMAVCSTDGTLSDPCGGLKDIQQAYIRMVSRKNLISDPIRLLRAYRMGAVLKFSIESQTRDALKEEAHWIKSSAPERVREEMVKLLSAPSASDYVKDMAYSGLLTAILPEMSSLKDCLQNKHHPDDAHEHSLKALSSLEDILNDSSQYPEDIQKAAQEVTPSRNHSLLKFAILIHDVGKSHTRTVDAAGDVHFYSHEKKSAELSDVITKRLRFSNIDQRYVHHIISSHMKPLFLFLAHCNKRLTPTAINRFFIQSGECAMDILLHAIADMNAKGAHPAMKEFMEFINQMALLFYRQFRPRFMQPPLVKGNDLIKEFGLSPSPLLGKILNHIETHRLQDMIQTREEALIMARIFLKSNHRS